MTQGTTPGEISLDAAGRMSWKGAPVAQLVAGRDMLAPDVQLLPSDLLDAEQQAALRKSLADWIAARLQRDLGPLLKLRAASEDAEVPGALRGLLFQIMEGLGAVPRDTVAAQLGALDLEGRKKLAQYGVRVGALNLFMPQLFGGRAVKRRALLWRVHSGALPELPPLLLAGQASVALAEAVPAPLLRALGYVAFGLRALRLDQAEKFAFAVRTLGRQGPFAPTEELATLSGVPLAELEPLLVALGLRVLRDEAGVVTYASRPPRGKQDGGKRPPRARREPRKAAAATDATTPAADGAEVVVAEGEAVEGAAPTGDAPDPAKRKKRRRRKKKPAVQAVAGEGVVVSESADGVVVVADGVPVEGAVPAGDAARKKRRRRKKKPAGEGVAATPVVPPEKPKGERPKQVWIIPPAREPRPADPSKAVPGAPGAPGRARQDGPRKDGPRRDGPRRDGPRRDSDRGDRVPRSYSDPKPRIDPDSPFAKLGELLAAKKSREPSES